MFYGMPFDSELIHALNDDGDSEEEGEASQEKDGKEKPKVRESIICRFFQPPGPYSDYSEYFHLSKVRESYSK